MTNKNLQRQAIVEEQKKKQTRTFLIVGGVIIALVLVFVLSKLLTAFTPRSEFSLGDPNAPVKVNVFSDFRCSHCAEFAENQEDQFIKDYVDTGKVYYTFINHPFLAADSMDAAVAASCAAQQGKFKEYSRELFSRYTEPNAFTAANLGAYAQTLGLDMEKFNACSADSATRSYINKGMLFGGKQGVTGTPSFLVNGKVVYSNALIQTVEAELAK